MKVLITGGSGFIGSNFIHYLFQHHPTYEVVNLDSLTYAGNRANLDDLPQGARYTFIRGDIVDKGLMLEVTKGIDAIVHFAAESHVDRAIEDHEAFIRTNIIGTVNLLMAARQNKVPRFHHVSTDEVFGQLGDEGAFDETTPYAPRNPYSASKASSDHFVRTYFHTYQLPITISNCSNNYGPRQFPEKFIPVSILNLMDNETIPVYGVGANVRDWLYVDDHCSAIDAILHHGKIGDTYSIGGGAELRNRDIAKRLVALMGKGEDAIQFVDDRPGHDYRYAMNASKIKQELGWEPKASFDERLASTVRWYQEHESWWHDIRSGRYRDRNEEIILQHS